MLCINTDPGINVNLTPRIRLYHMPVPSNIISYNVTDYVKNSNVFDTIIITININ